MTGLLTEEGRLSGFGYTPYSMGGTSNTYHRTPIVDAGGKELPWSDFAGRELTTVAQPFLPQPGQRFQLGIGTGVHSYLDEYR